MASMKRRLGSCLGTERRTDWHSTLSLASFEVVAYLHVLDHVYLYRLASYVFVKTSRFQLHMYENQITLLKPSPRLHSSLVNGPTAKSQYKGRPWCRSCRHQCFRVLHAPLLLAVGRPFRTAATSPDTPAKASRDPAGRKALARNVKEKIIHQTADV